MKFWTALITLLFLTATLQAQIPYGGYNLQPYYPGAIAPPYYPQAYYPQTYYPQPYYPQQYFVQTYTSSRLPEVDNQDEIDSLTRQVEQLNEQVRQLQAELELASIQAELDAREVEAYTPPPPPREPATPVALIFKNGKRIESQGYMVAGDTLWILTPNGSERMAVSKLNVAATQRENLKRGIHFPGLKN